MDILTFIVIGSLLLVLGAIVIVPVVIGVLFTIEIIADLFTAKRQPGAPPRSDQASLRLRINVRGGIYNSLMNEYDEQAQEIIEALNEYYANPEAYTLEDWEEIFQDRDPFEFM